MKNKIWMGSTNCDICHKNISQTLYDARIKQGCWAILCESCFKKYGIGLGTGSGQKYQKNIKTGEFEKLEG